MAVNRDVDWGWCYREPALLGLSLIHISPAWQIVMSIFLLLKRLGQNQDGSWFGWLWDLMQDLPNISHDPERIGARSPHFADRELTGAELRGPGCPVPLQDLSLIHI